MNLINISLVIFQGMRFQVTPWPVLNSISNPFFSKVQSNRETWFGTHLILLPCRKLSDLIYKRNDYFTGLALHKNRMFCNHLTFLAIIAAKKAITKQAPNTQSICQNLLKICPQCWVLFSHFKKIWKHLLQTGTEFYLLKKKATILTHCVSHS